MGEQTRWHPGMDIVRFEGHAPHRHLEPQLVHVVLGTAVLDVAGRRHPLREGESVWLPGGVEHALGVDPGGLVMGPFLSPGCEPPDGRALTLAEPSLHRLLLTVLGVRPTEVADVRAFREALDRTLRAVTGAAFPVPPLRHPAARAVAAAAVPGHETLQELAARQYLSVRQVQRLFLAETGLTFATWRTRVRLNAAVGRLSGGHGWDEAMRASGFRSREGLLKAIARETGAPVELVARDPLRAVGGTAAA